MEIIMSDYKPSSDILKAHQNDSTERLLVVLGNWIDTAAQHLSNEEYWRERALKAEGKSAAEIQDWGH